MELSDHAASAPSVLQTRRELQLLQRFVDDLSFDNCGGTALVDCCTLQDHLD